MKKIFVLFVLCMQIISGPAFADENIFKVISAGDLETVKQLVNKKPGVLKEKSYEDYNGITPLHLSVRIGEKKIAEFLLSKGANINAKDDEGWTPLHMASYGGFKGLVGWLLDNKADLQALCMSGSALHVAAMAGHAEVIELLVAKGMDVDLKFGELEWTPLHSAAYGGYVSAVRALVKLKADLHAKDKNGSIPFNIANSGGFNEICQFLADCGGRPD